LQSEVLYERIEILVAVKAEAPSRPIARGLAGPGLLAHVLVSKYCDHLPLYPISLEFRHQIGSVEAFRTSRPDVKSLF